MVQYKTIVPVSFIGNDLSKNPLVAQYGLRYNASVGDTYSEVYLRGIRFIIAYELEPVYRWAAAEWDAVGEDGMVVMDADNNVVKVMGYVLEKQEGDQAESVNIPYQFHLRWLDGREENYEPGRVLQNTMHHDISAGRILRYAPVQLNQRADYSTFCTPSHTTRFPEKKRFTSENNLYNGPVEMHVYDMRRDALIKRGAINSLNFEMFFTNLDGEEYKQYLPNVELEFELV